MTCWLLYHNGRHPWRENGQWEGAPSFAARAQHPRAAVKEIREKYAFLRLCMHSTPSMRPAPRVHFARLPYRSTGDSADLIRLGLGSLPPRAGRWTALRDNRPLPILQSAAATFHSPLSQPMSKSDSPSVSSHSASSPLRFSRLHCRC